MKSIDLKKSNSLKLDFLGDISQIFDQSKPPKSLFQIGIKNDPDEQLSNRNQKKGIRTLENEETINKLRESSSNDIKSAQVKAMCHFFEQSFDIFTETLRNIASTVLSPQCMQKLFEESNPKVFKYQMNCQNLKQWAKEMKNNIFVKLELKKIADHKQTPSHQSFKDQMQKIKEDNKVLLKKIRQLVEFIEIRKKYSQKLKEKIRRLEKKVLESTQQLQIHAKAEKETDEMIEGFDLRTKNRNDMALLLKRITKEWKVLKIRQCQSKENMCKIQVVQLGSSSGKSTDEDARNDS